MKPPNEHQSHIEDPDEISQKQRIREILERRRQTLSARNEARMSTLSGQISEEDALLYYRSHLESLIYELWNVFNNIETEDGKEYLNKKKLGTITINPPEDLLEEVKTWSVGVEPPEPKVIKIRGLQWYLERPDIIEVPFVIDSFQPPMEKTKTVKYLLRWGDIDVGLRACLEFIHLAGIDADLADIETEGIGEYEWVKEKITGDENE